MPEQTIDRFESLTLQIKELFADSKARSQALELDVKTIKGIISDMRSEMAEERGRQEGKQTAMETLSGRLDKHEESLVLLSKVVTKMESDLDKMGDSHKLVRTVVFGAIGMIVVAVFGGLIGLVVLK